MKKNQKKKLIIGIIIFILSIIGISYAYWILTYHQTGMNKLSSSCFSLSLTNEKNDINLQNAYPIIDEEGMKLTPYSFTITNTCDLFASYTVNLEMLENSTMPSKYIKVMLNKEATQNLDTYESTATTLDGSTDSKILATGSLGSGDSVDYTLRLWMDENTNITDTDSMNALFNAKVIISSSVSNYSPVEQGYTKLSDAILANEYQTTPDISKQKIASKQTVDFSKTAPIIDWQESHASTTSETTATMPHPDLVGNGESYTANLNASNILVRLGTGYTFNSTTGRYNITNYQLIDPTTITDYSSKIYYFCSAGFNTNASDLVQPYQNVSSCSTIYRVTSATASDSQITSPGGTVIKTKIFKINGDAYTQSELESDKSDKGLYQINDADGTSYYYRGSVTNNYVKFGGFYWRIIRINGDGSVRLLYAGTTSNATGNDLNTKLTDANLGYTDRITSSFNNFSDNPGYVGYMYGNTLNNTYAETNANENDSTIKKYLDSWYKQNILDKGLSSLIANNGLCNDRSLASTINYPDNGDGVKTDKTTYYGGFERYYKTHQPTLVCPNKANDLFTTSGSGKGNQKLTYPIGLITVDELMLSGLADGYLNRLSYAYSSYTYWTMSPSQFNVVSITASGLALHSDGCVSSSNYVTSSIGIRPVINLSSDTQITSGIGTNNDPYVIKVV